jgi:hypothetical protein
MPESWKTVKVDEVKAGDEVRTPSGDVLIVSRIEKPFLGLPNMVAFIQDTADRWFKQPLMTDADIEVRSI